MAMLYRADFCVGDTRSVVIVHTRRLRVRHRVAPSCGLGRVILRRRLAMFVVVCLAAAMRVHVADLARETRAVAAAVQSLDEDDERDAAA